MKFSTYFNRRVFVMEVVFELQQSYLYCIVFVLYAPHALFGAMNMNKSAVFNQVPGKLLYYALVIYIVPTILSASNGKAYFSHVKKRQYPIF